MVMGRRNSSASRGSALLGDNNFGSDAQPPLFLRRKTKSGDDLGRNPNSFHHYRPKSNRRNSIGGDMRDMPKNDHNNRNQEWAELVAPNARKGRVSTDAQSDCVTKHTTHSDVTQVRSNTTTGAARRAENFVSDMRDHNTMAAAPSQDEGRSTSKEEERRGRGSLRGSDTSNEEGRKIGGSGTSNDNGGRGSGTAAAGNTSRIISERKRRATATGVDANPFFRRDPLSPGHHAAGPNRRSTDMQSSMRRVNTASGALEKLGNHNFETQKQQPTGRTMRRNSLGFEPQKQQPTRRPMRRNSLGFEQQKQPTRRPMRRNSLGFEPQKLQPTVQPMRRNSTELDLKAVEELYTLRNSNISDFSDEFNNSLNRGNQKRRKSIGNVSDKSNDQRFPSGVRGRRRRTTRSSDGSRRRTTRSSSAGRDGYRNGNNPQDPIGGDINEELRQLRMNHHKQQQMEQLSPHRKKRRSSIASSELSFGVDDGEMAVISAPLGSRLSDTRNSNSEMGEFLREAALEANKSEHSWYMGRDPSQSTRYASSLGTSRHSSAPSAAVSAVPSDRTNDQRMFHNLLRGLKPSNDLLVGLAPRRGGRKLRWYERCSLSKRTIAIAFGLVFLATAMLGAVLLLSERGRFGSDGSVEKPGLTNVNHVKPPPSDIDGRCSASNLPGSLPACLEACYPASCCYGNSDSGTKCLDANDLESVKACQLYRPHCDIFHNTWDGATDGVLLTPRADLVPICQQVNGKVEKQSSKLRARNLLSRNLLVETAEVVCSQYCEAAKCCAKDTIFHPYSAGLELSASGVYTDAETKEYVVTNCQDDLVYQKNKDLCAEYDKFCIWDEDKDEDDVDKSEKSEAWTSRPTLDPASSMAPSMSPSKVPSMSPSMTLRPSPAPSINAFTMEWPTKPPIDSPSNTPSHSISPSHKFKPSSQPSLSSVPTISRANVTTIEAACAGADNIALMAEGNETARTKCLDACSEGLCCYTEKLGYTSSIDSCYVGNEVVCEEYSACLWLDWNSTNETSLNDGMLNSVSNGTVVNANPNSFNSSTVFDGTFAPSSKPSSETSTSIFDEAQSSNSTNTPSSIILTIEAPPPELAALCALGQGRFCTEICKDVSCCFEEAPELSCFSANTEICEGYAPCSVLYPQGS